MSRPVSIEVRGIGKSFRIPATASERSLRSRVRHPLRRRRGRMLDVLRDVSFEIERGEFFGIVGRNGSGKSTLLKILASVYGTDRGRVRIAGRLAPFLELGVGFQPQLPAYDNVIINGVMMGLSPDEARARYDEIIDFAGIRDQTDVELKNYSSGMKVRLGFSIMTHVDADILLVDEVLAVGDAEFQQKCDVAFRRMHAEGRTIVLVTHSMASISAYCERALLLHDGRVAEIGAPDEVANRYLQVNLESTPDATDAHRRVAGALSRPIARIKDGWLADGDGTRRREFPPHSQIELHAEIEAHELDEPLWLYFRIDNPLGQAVFVADRRGVPIPLDAVRAAGGRLGVRIAIESRLAPGRYVLTCAIVRSPTGLNELTAPAMPLSFEIAGEESGGLVALRHDVSFERAGEAVGG